MKFENITFAFFLVIAIPVFAMEPNFELPRAVQLGTSPEKLRPLLLEDCKKTEELHYTGRMAVPFKEQLQINCVGLQAYGGPRKVEFMFNDGPLGHVWIHLESEELGKFRGMLEEAFGKVVYQTEIDSVFASGNIALRSRPPEILVATPDLIAEITGYQAEGR